MSYRVVSTKCAFDAEYYRFERPGEVPTPLDRYVAAIYWSVMTLTSIGYGEMTPLNTTERVLCCGSSLS